MSKSNEIRVLNEKQIKQKLAGYKSAYTKKVNAAKTTKERKCLENGREAYVAERLHELMEQNKKQIQRRAGVLSWETRRANNAKRIVKQVEAVQTKNPVAKTASKKDYSSLDCFDDGIIMASLPVRRQNPFSIVVFLLHINCDKNKPYHNECVMTRLLC